MFLYPVLVALIMVFLRVVPSWPVWLAIAATFVGVIIIAGGLSAVGCIYLGRMIEGGNPGFDAIFAALYPEDKDMDYLNLEGDVKNGTQAMNAYLKAKDLTEKEREQLSTDLEKYCALDTLAVVKILKKLYEVSI